VHHWLGSFLFLSSKLWRWPCRLLHHHAVEAAVDPLRQLGKLLSAVQCEMASGRDQADELAKLGLPTSFGHSHSHRHSRKRPRPSSKEGEAQDEHACFSREVANGGARTVHGSVTSRGVQWCQRTCTDRMKLVACVVASAGSYECGTLLLMRFAGGSLIKLKGQTRRL